MFKTKFNISFNVNNLIKLFSVLILGCAGIAELANAAIQDPTLPTGYVKPAEARIVSGQPVLMGVIISGSYKTAIINGTLVKEGESVDGQRVTNISAYAVTLEGSKGRVTLHMLPERMKEHSK